MIPIINDLIFALLFTIFVECLVVIILGYTDKKFIMVIIAINAITNLTLNYILLIYQQHVGSVFINLIGYVILVFILEILVITIESEILSYVFGRNKKWLLISFIMNFLSFTSGLLFNYL
jgi:hypothetical protein